MRAVNLLPNQPGKRKIGWNSELSAGIAFTAIILVAVVGGFVHERSHADAARQQLAAAQAAYDTASAPQPTEHQTRLQTPEALQQVEPWHVALDSALSTRVSWDVLLSQLEYVVPPKVGLTTVTFGAPAGSASTTGATSATVSLGGTAFSLQGVGVFLSTLAKVPNLSQVALVNSAANVGSKVQTFQITAQVALPTVPVAPATADTTSSTGGQT